MKVLIFGGESRLAKRVGRLLIDGPPVVLVGREEADVRSMAQVMSAIEHHRPEVVLNCAAITNVDRCERQPDYAISVNALGAANIALVCRMKDIPLTHVSTDYVFSGSGGPKGHNDTTYPVNAYGLSKLLGESAVLSIMPRSVIVVRVGWLYGVEYEKSQPMIAALQGSLRTNKEVSKAYIHDNIKGTPTWVGHAAVMVTQAMSNSMIAFRSSTIVHASPQEHPVSWYEFLIERYDIVPMKEGMYKGARVGGKSRPRLGQPSMWRPVEGGLIPSEGWEAGSYRLGLTEFEREYEAYVAETGGRP